MFDVGFTELVLILVVSLLVLGPERLPGAIRTAGLWVARLRRSFNQIRTEIEREAHFDEIKRDLHNQSILDTLKGTADDLGKLRDLPYDVSEVVTRHAKGTTSRAVDSPPPSAGQDDSGPEIADPPPATVAERASASLEQTPQEAPVQEGTTHASAALEDLQAAPTGTVASQPAPEVESAPPSPLAGGARQP